MNRRLASILLMVVFLLHSGFKLSYTLYFFSNQAEIASRYCENKAIKDMNCGGCCHLAKTLQTMDKGQTGDRQTIPDPVNIRIEWFLQDTDELLVPVCIKTLATPRRNADEICTRPVDVVIPPPEA